MTVKELMERVPTSNAGYAIAYINDALREIQGMIDDNIKYAKSNIVKDQRFYSLPTDLVTLKNVMIYDTDETEYVRIPRVIHVESNDGDDT